jgi:hypothetical protein
MSAVASPDLKITATPRAAATWSFLFASANQSPSGDSQSRRPQEASAARFGEQVGTVIDDPAAQKSRDRATRQFNAVEGSRSRSYHRRRDHSDAAHGPSPLDRHRDRACRPGTPDEFFSMSGSVLRLSDQLTWSVETTVTWPAASCRHSASTSWRGRTGGLIWPCRRAGRRRSLRPGSANGCRPPRWHQYLAADRIRTVRSRGRPSSAPRAPSNRPVRRSPRPRPSPASR